MTEREKLIDKINGLYAWDTGCVSSGIKDDDLKKEIFEREDLLELLLDVAQDFVNEPYTFEDLNSFVEWVKSPDGLNVDWL